jgi:glutamate-1-semialdehyde 2,1-aminomutase
MPNRTPDEQRLLEKAGRYLPGGNTGNLHFNPEQDFLVASGKGSRVWDVSGNEYVDWLMGSGPMLLGHAHPHVVEAVIKTVEQGSTFFANNDKAVMLAEALVDAVPCAEQARFTTSGTDACFQAMRICRAFTGKEKVLKFEGGYHGSSDYALMSVTPSASLEFPQSEANSGGIPKAIADLMLIAPFNDIATTEAIIQAHHDELAAVIVEPMQRIIAPRPGFLQGLRDICDRYGVLLIADEVINGFGRTGKMFAVEHWDVVPDIMSVAKGIISSYLPLAATIATEEVAGVFAGEEDYLRHVLTSSGHPVSAAASLKNIEIIESENMVENAATVGAYFKEQVEGMMGDHPSMGDVRGIGLLVAIELVKDRLTKEPFAPEDRVADRLNETFKKHGLILRVGGPIINMGPPLCITTSEVDEIVHALDLSLWEFEGEMGMGQYA